MPIKPPVLGAVIKSVRAKRDDAVRRQAHPWRGWYGLKRWRLRREEQLAREPMCCMCAAEGKAVAATVADHVDRHNGDADKFWNGKLQSLCKPHHDRDKQRQEAGRRC